MPLVIDAFLLRAVLAGIGIAMVAGPLGCFVVWRRMAFFGDATAHAALLGVALALALALPVSVGTLAVAVGMAIAVARLSSGATPVDAVLGVLSHSALAFGLVAMSFVPGARVDLTAYLFGDILAVSAADVVMIWCGVGLISALIGLRWSAMLTATMAPELASASGLNPDRERLFLTLALALVVAMSIKVVGALLISAMLIVPAAAARPLSRSPEGMAAWSAVIGCVSALGGIAISYFADTPTGPTIVCAAASIYALTALLAALRRH